MHVLGLALDQALVLVLLLLLVLVLLLLGGPRVCPSLPPPLPLQQLH